MSRLTELLKRKDRLRDIERKDDTRFEPNPLGPGYITRFDRYTELYREIDKQIDAWITQDDPPVLGRGRFRRKA